MSDAPGFYPFAWHPGVSGQLLSLQAMGCVTFSQGALRQHFGMPLRKGI